MVDLYGTVLSRRDLSRRSGALSQFAGVRLVTLSDGLERGIRCLEFRTGTGLCFTVLVDRAMDIADCEHKGRAFGWHSPSGFRHPGLSDIESEGGLGWLRSFSGLLVTCGLDHVGFMAEEPAEHFNYGPRTTVRHSIHGRISTLPARLTGYGETWVGEDCQLWCEGVVQQATVFGEDLHLIRRIEAKVGADEIRISDRVINHGFSETPHMYCYHVNVGYPLLDEGARLVAPIRDVVFASHAPGGLTAQNAGYRVAIAPQDRFHEQVWQHEPRRRRRKPGAGRCGQRQTQSRLRNGIREEPLPLLLSMAEFPGRPLYDGYRTGPPTTSWAATMRGERAN